MCGLAKKIEAVKLVEDFEADAVAFNARTGVGHFEDGGWLIDFAKLGGGNHLVADCVGVSLILWFAIFSNERRYIKVVRV